MINSEDNFDYVKRIAEICMTRSVLMEFLSFIDRVNTLSFKPNFTPTSFYDEVPVKFLPVFQDLLNLNSLNELSVVLNKLRAELLTIPTAYFRVSFYPNNKFISQLYSWCASNLSNPLILDIETDSSILAGTIFSFNGKYLDLSLNNAVESFFKSNSYVGIQG